MSASSHQPTTGWFHCSAPSHTSHQGHQRLHAAQSSRHFQSSSHLTLRSIQHCSFHLVLDLLFPSCPWGDSACLSSSLSPLQDHPLLQAVSRWCSRKSPLLLSTLGIVSYTPEEEQCLSHRGIDSYLRARLPLKTSDPCVHLPLWHQHLPCLRSTSNLTSSKLNSF